MRIIELEQTESTNGYAKSNMDNLSDKTIIRAKSQTAGRGRLNRKWVDLGVGNLFMTIVLKPSGQFREIYSNLTQYLSVALCKVLESYGLNPEIKWPNDVLINGKKIAGILCETVVRGSEFKGLALGIGVNLNAEQSAVDSVPDKIVTALNLELNTSVDSDKFTDELSEEFFNHYDEFLNTGFEYIKEDYIKRNCFLGKDLKVQILNQTECGIAEEITDKGELVLINGVNNKQSVLTIGDIL